MPNAKTAHETATHKFLLLGDTGTGKTSKILTLPGKKFAYLFDPNAILSLQGFDIDYEEFMPDRLNLNVKSLSNKVPSTNITQHKNTLYDEWQSDFEDRLNSGFFADYDVIAFVSATTLLDLIMDRILTMNGRAGQWPQQDDYGPQMVTFTNICRALTSQNKTILMTGHLDTRQDELTKKVFRQPMMTGRLRTKIPLLFSDIFVCDTDIDVKGNVRHRIQTVPDRITATVRTSIKGLNPYEDVTIDWNESPQNQGIGKLLRMESAGEL